MQPYPNPNYFNLNSYPQGYVSPAQQNLFNQYSQQNYPSYSQLNNVGQQQQGLIGRAVNDFSEITANDVPMDGRNAFFPKADLSEIQVRTWGNDGKIIMTAYKPILDTKNNQTVNSSNEIENLKFDLSDEATGAFMKRFDELSERLEMLEQSWSKSWSNSSKSTAKAKKGDD